MNVLLLKEPREAGNEPDPYIKLFQPNKHGGLIFTSPRAVEAVKMCLDANNKKGEWENVRDKWNTKTIYVVGKATAALVEELGLSPLGEDTGTADVLSRLILEREDRSIMPLFFPCGSIKREVLPTALRDNGIPLETLTVYQTAQHPDLEKNLTNYFAQQGVPASVAFFSPSGVKFCLETVRRLSGPQLSQIKFAAIGPTTADALAAEGLPVSGSAEKPTAQHLAAAIAQALVVAYFYGRYTYTTMLTLGQQISFLSLTIIGAVFAEKLFHSRDHSDVIIPPSHQAELVTDEDTAEGFLSKYGFIKSVKWEEVEWNEEESSGDFTTGYTMSLIQEGDYLSRSVSGPTESTPFITALKDFQRVSGLPVTGLFDDATKAAMNKPRCGVPDKATDPSITDGLTTATPDLDSSELGSSTETNQEQIKHSRNKSIDNRVDRTDIGRLSRRKRHLADLLGKKRGRRQEEAGFMAFSKTVLRWRLIGEGYSSQLSIDDQRYIFRLAFRMWSEVSPLKFVEDFRSPLENIDIRLGFGTGRHLGCTQRFDGAGREFAHAWFLGDIHFDDDEHFTAPNTGDGISLLKVAVHEIGHVLGLPHIYRAGSIMQPSYLPQEASFELDWQDRKAIQHLYGSCKGRFSTVFDWIRKERTPYGEVRIRFNTYFMRDGWYWLYENRNNRTRYGDPVAIQVGWHGMPASGVDAYVHVWTRNSDAVYFFKGTQFWKYDTENDQVFTEDEEGQHYPRPISEGFPGVPSPIDTAFYDRRDSFIYFFRGALVYAFDVRANGLAMGYPKKITQVFPAVLPGNHPVANLDVAYFSYTHNAIFLLKDSSYWRVVSSRDRWRRPALPYNGLLPRREVHEQWFDICNVHSTALKVARR
ncbi:hypothetical protein ACEWY4_026248 [Coilia grayii]|uniref:Uroporphyrinogen-III synthase n=1 Tax=Coilia grayii TaxID=363190 RepID=A0ABD1IUA7_9TELE